jgi:3',5'-cyclic-AMP phosphodiesterase
VIEVTTVGDDVVVLHDGGTVHRFDGLEPDRSYELLGVSVRTLPRPDGELLCRFATVNDVHFGEFEAGHMDGLDAGPILSMPPGAPLHPTVMNAAAVQEMAAIDPVVVVVKGDLTLDGADHEYAEFLAVYGGAFGERLHHVRGNHDAYHGQSYAAGNQVIDVPGVRIALLDTVIQGETTGRLDADDLEWLDAVAAESDRPVMAMGHHHAWMPGSKRSDTYFGLHPDASEALIDVIARRASIIAYTAGHTHRNRVRRTAATGAVPYIEVSTVKDFPGSWAEYRVYEGGVIQLHHRVCSPAALAWSEQCRHLYEKLVDYSTYGMGALDDRCLVITPR